ncbi:Clp protease N-terminal domain-containing protein [Streptosporangium sp. V21-05]|uniref:Clp protease N-terminal domain-containing protein n=1 Tax=Streptosporangium sp. V21-05 TaxID=3446115 RepID=UPI003F539641
MFARFTPEARRTTVRAGLLSLDHGRTTLDEDVFLLALAESWPVTGSVTSSVTGPVAGPVTGLATAPETAAPSAVTPPGVTASGVTASGVSPETVSPEVVDAEAVIPGTGTSEAVGTESVTPAAVTPDAVGAEIRNREAARGRAGDRELLAAIGVDLDAIRRRLPARREDPLAWRLTRSRLRPLNVTLSGPAGDLLLTARARKVVEVALYTSGSEVTDEDLLKGLLADSSNTSVAILRGLGVDLRDLAASIGFLREPA